MSRGFVASTRIRLFEVRTARRLGSGRRGSSEERPITFLSVRQGVFERKNTRREAGGLSENKEKASIHDCVQCLLKMDHSSRFRNDRSFLKFVALAVYSLNRRVASSSSKARVTRRRATYR